MGGENRVCARHQYEWNGSGVHRTVQRSGSNRVARYGVKSGFAIWHLLHSLCCALTALTHRASHLGGGGGVRRRHQRHLAKAKVRRHQIASGGNNIGISANAHQRSIKAAASAGGHSAS
jgi:hypothetical protein